MRVIKTVIGLSIAVIIIGCQGGANPLSTQEFIEIRFPLNQKCIYASLFLVEEADSAYLDGLHLFSLIYDDKITTTDEIKYSGRVTCYAPPTLSRDNKSQPAQIVSGEIQVTVKNNWVLYQFSEVYEAFNMFIKINADTMDLPTQFESQFPSFPQIIVPYREYSAYRPENSGLGWGYTGVYREFNTSGFSEWSTNYSRYRGIYISGIHELLSFRIEMEMIVDEAGIVISRLSFGESILVNEQGIPVKTVQTYVVNQRLVDYTQPDLLSPLSDYAAQILAGDNKFLSLF